MTEEPVEVIQAARLRERGWKQDVEGVWWFPRSTIPPLDTPNAYKMSNLIEEIDQ